MVARLAKGATLVRYLGETSGRVTLALGRNKQAKLPPDRVLLTTGLVGLSDDEIEAFRRECEAISSDIELSDVWEVVRDEATSWNLGALAELRWGASTDIAHLVAMALRLNADHDYFVYGKDGYTPRTEEDVEDIRVRRKREAERAEAAASLMSHLTQGTLPHPLPASQAPLLEHLRAYAIHGDDYARSPTAKGLLGTAGDATGDPQRRSFELLVAAGVFGADEPLELHRAGIVADLPEDAVSEAAAIHLSNVEAFSKRTDLTALPTITIDDPATLDRDDAISFERLEDAADVDGSSYRVGVHIADAAAIIPLGGAIDREADRRMSTLYLPERTIGMLPAQVSHELGSLEAGETRAAISVLVRFSHLDEVTDWDVVPSVVRSDGSLSYEDADQAVADKSGRWHSMLHRLHQAAQSLRSRRESAGAVNLDRAEMTIMVRSAGAVEVKVVQRSTAARELVTELMILCNSLLADFARRNQLPAVFRSQGPPDLADMPSDIRKGDGPAGDTLWRHLLMKRLPPAQIGMVPSVHSGLGVQAYLQASSPLRRYPDLAIQRQISYFLSEAQPVYSEEAIASIGNRAEVQLRDLAHLEEGRKRYWFLKYLQQSRLEQALAGSQADLFTAFVLENDFRRTGLLELAEFPFRVRAELPLKVTPGDTVTLRLRSVDLWRRVAYFIHSADER